MGRARASGRPGRHEGAGARQEGGRAALSSRGAGAGCCSGEGRRPTSLFPDPLARSRARTAAAVYALTSIAGKAGREGERAVICHVMAVGIARSACRGAGLTFRPMPAIRSEFQAAVSVGICDRSVSRSACQAPWAVEVGDGGCVSCVGSNAIFVSESRDL